MLCGNDLDRDRTITQRALLGEIDLAHGTRTNPTDQPAATQFRPSYAQHAEFDLLPKDVRSLACTVTELLTPFPARFVAAIRHRLESPPSPTDRQVRRHTSRCRSPL